MFLPWMSDWIFKYLYFSNAEIDVSQNITLLWINDISVRVTLKSTHLTLFGNHLLVRAMLYAPCCEFWKVCCFVYKHTKWKIELQIWYVKTSRDTKCQNERNCVTSYDDNLDIVPTTQTCLEDIFIILHSMTNWSWKHYRLSGYYLLFAKCCH